MSTKSRAVFTCLSYSIASIVMILLNKSIIDVFNFPNAILFVQCLISAIALYLGKCMGYYDLAEIEMPNVQKWIPVNALFLLMLFSGFHSLRLLSIPMYLVFKNTNNLLVALGDRILFGQMMNKEIFTSLILLVFAAVCAAKEDLQFSLQGYIWAIFNMLATTGYLLYLRHVMYQVNLSQLDMVFHNNLLAIPFIVFLDIITKQDLLRFLHSEQLSFVLLFDFNVLILWSGVMGVLLNLTSFMCMKETSPTTYALVGTLNKVPLAILGAYLFDAPMTMQGWIFVFLSIIAGFLYVFAKHRRVDLTKIVENDEGVQV